MDYKLMAIETFVIAVCYIILAWPMASATTVNIIFNGQSQATTELSIENILNKQITAKHDPSDITWTDVKIPVLISSASLSHTIEKIYLYKCKSMTPSSCVMTEPQVFDKWIDTELAWADISQRAGTGTYPQEANLLIIIKLIGPNGRSSWVGSWDTITRTDYQTFDPRSHELASLDFYAKSSDLVLPVKSFIDGFQMIPFNWADKVVLQGATSFHGLGGSEADLQASPPQLQSAQPTNNEIDTINKDFYFVLAETSSGISVPTTLNLNPSFSCGDNFCEADLGETVDTCCHDCGCPEGEYCDVAGAGQTGSCKDDSGIALQVQPLTTPTITDCSLPFTASVKLKINAPPSSLSDSITAYITLEDDIYSSTCTKDAGLEYTCSINLNPEIRCGSGSKQKGPNTVNATITYNDGPNTVSKDLSATFQALTVTYDCLCQDGYYCDSGETRCKPEGSIGLQILNMTSYMPNYNSAGDNIIVNARVTNPPSDLTTTGTATYQLGSLYKGNSLIINGTSGNAQCTGGSNTNHVYTCSIPIHITGYDQDAPYYFKGNSLSLSASFSNGGTQVVKPLSAPLSDVTIPSHTCGDGDINPGETEETCCLDVGCSGTGKYCDAATGCQYISNVTLSIATIQPDDLEDCKRNNPVTITAKINNIPHGVAINYIYYYKDGEMTNWGLQCSTPSSVTGMTDCLLEIPPIDGCQLPHYTVGPNSLNMTITFPDGSSSSVIRHLSTPFDDILIKPIWHCGQYECESDIGENGSNCCIDCGCSTDQYCDYDPQYNPNGQCGEKNDIRLIIDKPTSTVHLDSCEVGNEVEIVARVENQPSGMVIENFYGDVNGSSTSRADCDRAGSPFGNNITYLCKVKLPSIFECSRGKTYEYGPNSLSLFVSYPNGVQQREVQTLTASYPNIVIKQSIRTIYDITKGLEKKWRDIARETYDLASEMKDAMEECLELLKIIMIVGAVLTLVTAIAGIGQMAQGAAGSLGGTQGAFTQSIANSQSAFQTAGAMALTTSMLANTIGEYCNKLQAYYEALINMQQLEGRIASMEACLEIAQHTIDTGGCRGASMDCYERITSCLNFDAMKAAMGDIRQSMQSMTASDDKIQKGWTDVARAWQVAGAGSRGRGTLQASCGNTNECCNSYVDRKTNRGEPICGYNDLKVVVNKGVGCKYPVVKYFINDFGFEMQPLGSTSPTPLNLRSGLTKDTTKYEFFLYCFDSYEDYELMGGTGGTEPTTDVGQPVTVHKADTDTCECAGMASSS
jgi:hypothetical protein